MNDDDAYGNAELREDNPLMALGLALMRLREDLDIEGERAWCNPNRSNPRWPRVSHPSVDYRIEQYIDQFADEALEIRKRCVYEWAVAKQAPRQLERLFSLVAELQRPEGYLSSNHDVIVATTTMLERIKNIGPVWQEMAIRLQAHMDRQYVYGEPEKPVFVPDLVQAKILSTLCNRILTLDKLEAATGIPRKQIYDKLKHCPTGRLQQLMELGFVKHIKMRAGGFYRPDAPPPGMKLSSD